MHNEPNPNTDAARESATTITVAQRLTWLLEAFHGKTSDVRAHIEKEREHHRATLEYYLHEGAHLHRAERAAVFHATKLDDLRALEQLLNEIDQ